MSKTKLELRDWAKTANLLTSLKFITVPMMVYFAYLRKTHVFILFLLLSWFIDFIDGTIAHKLRQETKLGYYLDTYTDGFYLIAILFFLYINDYSLILRYSAILAVLAALILLNSAVSLMKFREIFFLHLWSAKLAANLLPLFFISFLWSPDIILMDSCIFLCVLALVETFFIFMKVKKVDEGVLTIFDLDGKNMAILKSNLKLLPNRITLIRFILLPFLLYFAYKMNVLWFSILFYIAFLTDQLDGIVARRLDQCSAFGSDMDAVADDIYNALSLLFLYLMRKEAFFSFLWLILPLFTVFIIDKIIHIIKFKAKIRLHLYSGKVYQRYFYIVLPLIIFLQHYQILFYILIFLGFYTSFERIGCYYKYKALNKDIRSLMPLRYNPFYYIMKYWP
jgi:CDP-diacylglycerol--glycerol-3-phosphate 3-phosphatidyltransferase